MGKDGGELKIKRKIGICCIICLLVCGCSNKETEQADRDSLLSILSFNYEDDVITRKSDPNEAVQYTHSIQDINDALGDGIYKTGLGTYDYYQWNNVDLVEGFSGTLTIDIDDSNMMEKYSWILDDYTEQRADELNAILSEIMKKHAVDELILKNKSVEYIQYYYKLKNGGYLCIFYDKEGINDTEPDYYVASPYGSSYEDIVSSIFNNKYYNIEDTYEIIKGDAAS